MSMKAIKVIFYICILFVIMSCAHTQVPVQFCENNKCAVLTEADSKEAIFLKLTAMIKANLHKKIPLMVSSNKGDKADKDIVVEWSNSLGRRLVQINSLTFTDILFTDRETREVKVIAHLDLLQPESWTTGIFGSYPSGSYIVQMPCSLTVKSSNEIIFQGRGKFGIFDIYLDGLIDHVDADSLFWGSMFSMIISGPSVAGRGEKKGYLHLAFQEAGQKTGEVLAVTQAPQAKPDIPKPAKEGVEVITAQLPRLAYVAQLKDQNNNKVLDGGEEIRLRVEVENTGEGTANDVSIELSGQKEIIDTLGSMVKIGDIKPKQKKVYEFKGFLPANIPSTTALLRVRIHEINGYSPASGKNFQVAMKASETATEQTEIMSEIDVDDIPARIKGIENKNNYAVVIGISTYRDKIIPKVKYAGRDAETMARYLEHLAGIPKDNVLIKTDADVTKGDLEEYFESWLPRRVTSDSIVYIYYAGHGTPDPAGQDAFIVPYEGHPDSPGKLYPLKKMYAALNKLPAKQVVVMLDSCFSGAEGRSVLRKGTRPLVMSVENQVLTGNKVVVIAGAKGNQMSSDYDKVKHGLFTYYVLRGLRGEADTNGNGIVDVGELYEYVKQSVTQKASLELNRDQTPDLLPGKAARSVLSVPIARTK